METSDDPISMAAIVKFNDSTQITYVVRKSTTMVDFVNTVLSANPGLTIKNVRFLQVHTS